MMRTYLMKLMLQQSESRFFGCFTLICFCGFVGSFVMGLLLPPLSFAWLLPLVLLLWLLLLLLLMLLLTVPFFAADLFDAIALYFLVSLLWLEFIFFRLFFTLSHNLAQFTPSVGFLCFSIKLLFLLFFCCLLFFHKNLIQVSCCVVCFFYSFTFRFTLWWNETRFFTLILVFLVHFLVLPKLISSYFFFSPTHITLFCRPSPESVCNDSNLLLISFRGSLDCIWSDLFLLLLLDSRHELINCPMRVQF